MCEEEKLLTLWSDAEFLGDVCKVVHGGTKRLVSVCVCICARTASAWQSECEQHVCRGACLGDVCRAGRRHVCVRAAVCVGTLHLLLARLQQHLALHWARYCLLPVCSGTATFLGYRPFSSCLLNLFPSVCLSALLPVSSCLLP